MSLEAKPAGGEPAADQGADGVQQMSGVGSPAGTAVAAAAAAAAGAALPVHGHNTRHRRVPAEVAGLQAVQPTNTRMEAANQQPKQQQQQLGGQQYERAGAGGPVSASLLQPRLASPRLAARHQQHGQQPQADPAAAPAAAHPVAVPRQAKRPQGAAGAHAAAAPAAGELLQQHTAQQQEQPAQQVQHAVQQQQQQPAALLPPCGQQLRSRQRGSGSRRVSFAPGPWSEKFATADGHPDHEGQLARQRRSAGAAWGRDLTPSAVRAVEAELGEACQPSIDRLKRRVGLLPLRKRPREYLMHVNGCAALPEAANGSGQASGSAEGSRSGGDGAEGLAVQQQQKKLRDGGAAAPAAMAGQQQQQQEQQQALVGAEAPAAASTKSKAGRQLPPKLNAHPQGGAGKAGALGMAAAAAAAAGVAGGLLAKLASGAGLPQVAVTFSRKRGSADALGSAGPAAPCQPDGAGPHTTAGSAAAAGAGGGAAVTRRASQRLGGLSGPVGSPLLSTFSQRAGGSGSTRS